MTYLEKVSKWLDEGDGEAFAYGSTPWGKHSDEDAVRIFSDLKADCERLGISVQITDGVFFLKKP